MATDFAGEKFASKEAFKNRLCQFTVNRNEGIYESGIMEFHSKGQQVVEQKGAYLT